MLILRNWNKPIIRNKSTKSDKVYKVYNFKKRLQVEKRKWFIIPRNKVFFIFARTYQTNLVQRMSVNISKRSRFVFNF